MAGSFDNLIRFNATSPGTVDFVVASAPVNCVTPEQAGAIDGKIYRYFARSADGSVWEWGSGAYVYASHTMSRTTISSTSVSSITNGILDKIVFAVAPIVDVFPASVARLEPPAANYVPWDAPIALTSNQKAQARANIDVLKKNYIINGAMMVSQENGTTAGTTNGYYPVDQFLMLKFTTGVASCAQVAAASPAGSPNRLRVTVSTADTSLATNEFVTIYQYIEANYTADLRFGSASAKSCTLQFGVKAPAGVYCVTLSNGAQNRAFVAEFTIAAGEANTDVVKSVTIVGDVTGVWGAGNAAGILVSWTLAAGSLFQTTPGAWTSGNKLASTNQLNFMGTLGNVFELFDVSLTEGNSAPSFYVPEFITEVVRCQRYWEKSYDYGTRPGTVTYNGAHINYSGTADTLAMLNFDFAIEKRAVPTMVAFSPVSGASGFWCDNNAVVNVTVSWHSVGTKGAGGYSFFASSQPRLEGHYTANARLA